MGVGRGRASHRSWRGSCSPLVPWLLSRPQPPPSSPTLLTRGIMKLWVSSNSCRLSRALWASDGRFFWMPCGARRRSAKLHRPCLALRNSQPLPPAKGAPRMASLAHPFRELQGGREWPQDRMPQDREARSAEAASFRPGQGGKGSAEPPPQGHQPNRSPPHPDAFVPAKLLQQGS